MATKRWQKHYTAILRRLNAKRLTDAEIGRYMGFAECTIQQQRKAHGIPAARSKFHKDNFLERPMQPPKPWPAGVDFT